MQLAFDLDDTLVATRAAHLAAYRAAGVEPPEDFNVRHWSEWCSEEAHSRKGELFDPVHTVMLPAARILQKCGGTVLTTTSLASLHKLAGVHDWLLRCSVNFQMPLDQKLEWLQEHDPGIYFDNHTPFVERVRKETKWQAVDVSQL